MFEAYNLPNNQKKKKKILYGLKQSGYMWYNCFSEYLFKELFKKNPYLSMY